MASIQLKNVGKTYPGGVRAVFGVDLEIADGEFVVLVGPSGCGKSTTLRMIAGLEEATEGEIYIGERLVNQVEPGDRDIAMVFQNYALYPHMSVRQNLAFGLKMRKVVRDEIDRRVAHAAEILSISGLLDRRPRELSGGQRQRVALGRAIVRDPKVFLFDEPLSNLDAKLRSHTRTEIARLHQRLRTTMVYVTHDQVEAMTLGDRIVVLRDGLVQQVDTPIELYSRPANRFVAGFIGSPMMNFFSGRLERGDFVAGERRIPLDTDLPDRDVVLGVRPEDIFVDGAESTLTDGPLEVVEQMGHETIVHFTVAGQEAVARLPGAAGCRPGDRFGLSLRPGSWHLFEATQEGKRLNSRWR